MSGDSLGRWLLIYDNVDNAELLRPRNAPDKGVGSNLIDCVPSSKQGHIVFTTRDRETAVRLASSNVVEVSVFDEDAAKKMLQNHLVNLILPSEQGEANALLRELAYLPLALVQAAAFMNQNGVTIENYRTLLAGQEQDAIKLLSENFEDDWRYRSAHNPVAITWFTTFSQIRRQDALAADYLSFMACIDRTGIPEDLLPSAQSRRKEIQAVGVLVAYSLVNKHSGATLEVHHLVHLAMRNWLRQQDLLEQWTEEAVSRLLEIFPSQNHSNRNMWRKMLPHVRYVLASGVVRQGSEARVQLAWKYAMALYTDGYYDEAEIWFQEILETWMTTIGQDHPSTLSSMANLASTYRHQGRWKEAEELEVQVVVTRRKVLGEEHPDTLLSLGNLASTYRNQGRWKEAEELEVQVMMARRKVLGEEHSDTLLSLGNLASTYRNQGRWKEAEELEVQVMIARRKVLGEEHPDTLLSLGNLASTYRNQGRWKEAEELEVQVMEMSKRVLGPEHPDTLTSMANLASTLWNQGQWKEVEELEVQVIEMSKRVLGPEHPDTLTSIANLASTLWNQGRWEEAEELEVQVIEISKKKLGADHPSTLTSMANLASTYGNLGRWEAAEELGVQVMEVRKKKLGDYHPDTISAMNNLAFIWKKQAREEEALELMDKCASSYTRVLGAEHPHTLSSAETLIKWKAEKLYIDEGL